MKFKKNSSRVAVHTSVPCDDPESFVPQSHSALVEVSCFLGTRGLHFRQPP